MKNLYKISFFTKIVFAILFISITININTQVKPIYEKKKRLEFLYTSEAIEEQRKQLKKIEEEIRRIEKEKKDLGQPDIQGYFSTDEDDKKWDELQKKLVEKNSEKKKIEDKIKEQQIKEIQKLIKKNEEQIKKIQDKKIDVMQESENYQKSLVASSRLDSIKENITRLNEEKWKLEKRQGTWKKFILDKTYSATMKGVITFLQTRAGHKIFEKLSAALLLGDFITASKLALLLDLDLSEFNNKKLSSFMSDLGITKDFEFISQILLKLGWHDVNSMTFLDLAKKLKLDWTDSKWDKEKKISLIITIMTVLTVCHQVALMGGIATSTYIFIRNKYGVASYYFSYIGDIVKKNTDRVMYLKKLWTGEGFVS